MLGVINLNCMGSVRRWCMHWNVTRVELEIAIRRVGPSPSHVARELGMSAGACTGLLQVHHDAA
jgi:hypothetical protein